MQPSEEMRAMLNAAICAFVAHEDGGGSNVHVDVENAPVSLVEAMQAAIRPAFTEVAGR